MNLQLFDAKDVRLAVPHGASNEWYTPRWVLDWLGPIAMDPCWAPGSNVACDAPIDVRTHGDSLLRHWADLVPSNASGIVYCNPPYSDCSRWVEKCNAEAPYLDKPLVALVPAYAGDTYWHRAIWNKAEFVGFICGRIRFDIGPGIAAKDSASFCSALVIWGRDPAMAKRTMLAIASQAGRKVHWIPASGRLCDL